ncbi:ABC-type transport auxiliary lipoprotein family protein [Martelella radicis]|uniref:Cholesterol transport system auxiliary component n=1 Tax=Martelella radicis TaxID=1397476 RepID=A0A7W6P9F4_9HYPH|nr:ABC-type transport auxiliary lipoprotein family protein [Martelella radicis]MBB4120342.1 cholesterol transport system auxiliary component [Martelella radicis]
MFFAATERASALAGPLVGLSLLVAGLSGCALRPPSDTFDLTAKAAASEMSANRARTARLQLLVPAPSAIQVLDNRGIVVRLSGSELRYLKNAQWSDLLPAVVQARLVAGLENTGLFGGVGMPGQGLAIDYQVVVEIREFAIDAAGPGTADVKLSVKLLDDRTGVVRAQRLFESSVGVNSSASSGVLVAALDKAFADVQADIVSWIAATL